MQTHIALSADRHIAATLDWWRLAGVDCDYLEEAQNWLAEPEKEVAEAIRKPTSFTPAEPPPPPPKPMIGGEPENWPGTLEAFQLYWSSDASMDLGGSRQGFRPTAPAGLPLMVLVPMPEADGQLFDPATERMIAAMLKASGLDMEQVYLAPALPRRMTLPDWGTYSADGLNRITCHHVALAAPKRLLILGSDILPLLGHDPAQASPRDNVSEIQGSLLPTLTTVAPHFLFAQPRERARLWQRWLDWTI